MPSLMTTLSALATLWSASAHAQTADTDAWLEHVIHHDASEQPSGFFGKLEARQPSGFFGTLAARRNQVEALTEVKITGSDPNDASFGVAAALDGRTALVGAAALDSNTAYIFERSGSRWVEGQRLAPPDAPFFFGLDVDIDGDRAVVLGLDGPVDAGGVYVYVRGDDGQWSFEQKLVNPDGLALGFSASIAGDTIVAGAATDGAAYVFELGSTGWSQTQVLTGSDTVPGDGFASSVKLVDDTLVVGAFDFTTSNGAAYVFERDVAGFAEVQKLTASDGAVGGRFAAFGIALYEQTLAIGDDANGAVYVYDQKPNGDWVEAQKIAVDDPTTPADFGFSVDLEGNTLVVGARNEEGGGATYIYRRAQGQWDRNLRIASSDAEQDDAFGQTVSLDGATLLVGALGDEGFIGGSYVYDLRVPGVPNLLGASLGNADFGGLGACANQNGFDGLPVVFDRQVAPLTVDVTDFEIVTATGARVQPTCVSFAPSINLDEGQTILTQADYGPQDETPLSVEIVGSIRSFDRTVDYEGLSVSVAPFEVGGILVYARQLPVIRLGGFQQCPVGTGQIIQLGFGSNASNNNFPTDPDTLASFAVTLEDGTVASPFAFADILVDNYLELCLTETSPASFLEIAPQTIMNAGGVMNPETLRAIVAP